MLGLIFTALERRPNLIISVNMQYNHRTNNDPKHLSYVAILITTMNVLNHGYYRWTFGIL